MLLQRPNWVYVEPSWRDRADLLVKQLSTAGAVVGFATRDFS